MSESRRLTPGRVGAAVGAALAAAASLVAVLSFVGEKTHHPPQAAESAEIRSVTLDDRAESLGDYLDEVRPDQPRRFTAAQRRQPGFRFLIGLRAVGATGTRLRLRWELFQVGKGPVPGAAYSQVASDFETSATNQARRWPVWVPYPTRSGRYFVRFTLEDSDQRPVDERKSVAFVFHA